VGRVARPARDRQSRYGGSHNNKYALLQYIEGKMNSQIWDFSEAKR
jgi:hypothetical protein